MRPTLAISGSLLLAGWLATAASAQTGGEGLIHDVACTQLGIFGHAFRLGGNDFGAGRDALGMGFGHLLNMSGVHANALFVELGNDDHVLADAGHRGA